MVYQFLFLDQSQQTLRHPLRLVSKTTHDEITCMILHTKLLVVDLRALYIRQQVVVRTPMFLPGPPQITWTSWFQFKHSVLSQWIGQFSIIVINDYDYNIDVELILSCEMGILGMDWYRGVPGPRLDCLANSLERILAVNATWYRDLDQMTIVSIENFIQVFRQIVQNESRTIFGGPFGMY